MKTNILRDPKHFEHTQGILDYNLAEDTEKISN
jgi:hypothetical protein